MLALVMLGAPAGWAERLDKRTCKTLKVELAGMLAVGIKDDMERGPLWAKDNLPPEKLAKIRRLIEVEEQLEFRCGMRRSRVVAVSPAKGPGRKKAPEEPKKKPSKVSLSTDSEAVESPPEADKKVVKKQAVKKQPQKKKQAAAAKKPPARRREASTYVSPREVNPYSLSRYGGTTR